MQQMLSPEFLKLIDVVAEHSDVNVYLVGGIVRDLIMSRPNVDLDFVVEGDAIAFATALNDQHGGALQIYRPFGTATWTSENGIQVDFASARTESYPRPGDLPIVSLTPHIREDLQRRDFTLNALAIEILDYELVDRFGGEADIANGVIRTLHDKSFMDDPTRIFRAARFEQRFDFKIEPHTESLIAPALPILDRISGERIRHEIDVIFKEDEPEKALVRLDELGALRTIDPNLRADNWLVSAFHYLWFIVPGQPDQLSYWPILAFRLDSFERLLARLPLERQIVVNMQQVKRAVTFVKSAVGLRPSQFVRGIEPLDDLYARCAAYAIALVDDQNTPLKDYIENWQYVQPVLTGDNLKRMGLTPGPLFGKLLRQLRDDLLDGKITHEQEYARVQELIALWKTPD